MGFTVVTERIKHEFSKSLLKEHCQFDFLNFKHFSPSTFKSMPLSEKSQSCLLGLFQVRKGLLG